MRGNPPKEELQCVPLWNCAVLLVCVGRLMLVVTRFVCTQSLCTLVASPQQAWAVLNSAHQPLLPLSRKVPEVSADAHWLNPPVRRVKAECATACYSFLHVPQSAWTLCNLYCLRWYDWYHNDWLFEMIFYVVGVFRISTHGNVYTVRPQDNAPR